MRFCILTLCLLTTSVFALPKGFVYLADLDPTIIQDLRYHTKNNFIGRPIKGYQSNRCILTKRAAIGLVKVQKQLKKHKQSLIVYDCYRPQQAVNDFYHWSINKNSLMKKIFYPRELKKYLFSRGYIAKFSGHSRGSTVDLSIYNNDEYKPNLSGCYKIARSLENSIDMGTNFDCLDPKSAIYETAIPAQAKNNRKQLRKLMKKYGFKPYKKEWWHFTYSNETFPKSYFNFKVK